MVRYWKLRQYVRIVCEIQSARVDCKSQVRVDAESGDVSDTVKLRLYYRSLKVMTPDHQDRYVYM